MREARRRLLSRPAEMAGGEALLFAAGSEGYTDAVLGARQVMYRMSQCTRDLLPASECTGCLVDHLAVMYRDVSVISSTVASVMGTRCYLTYQLNKPILIAGMAPPPSPSAPTAEPPTGSAPSSPGGRTPLIAALAVAAGAVTLFVVGLGSREGEPEKRKNERVQEQWEWEHGGKHEL
ncbi:hypothetical protein E2562_023172 [Oryza meyeriana var. granulata]|uniref:Gnk2-homologous domain-containing protein n=1 Tax=Oryza meyeriana var. granulata TaxID=110450 RepID=A0A6G1BYC0_9ORYZ|nr:hypothetical protein E2562_023172 [Oryza meyeriana var. granulata]